MSETERLALNARVDAAYPLGTWLRLIVSAVLGAALALVMLVATAGDWM